MNITLNHTQKRKEHKIPNRSKTKSYKKARKYILWLFFFTTHPAQQPPPVLWPPAEIQSFLILPVMFRIQRQLGWINSISNMKILSSWSRDGKKRQGYEMGFPLSGWKKISLPNLSHFLSVWLRRDSFYRARHWHALWFRYARSKNWSGLEEEAKHTHLACFFHRIIMCVFVGCLWATV